MTEKKPSFCRTCGQQVKWEEYEWEGKTKRRPLDLDGGRHWNTHPDCHPKNANNRAAPAAPDAATTATLRRIENYLAAICLKLDISTDWDNDNKEIEPEEVPF